MKLSKLFTKTKREVSKDEESINAQLLGKGGFINKEMAGVYSYLPLGLKVYKKIENIIREEMNLIDGQEVFMPTLQPKENWLKTNRWNIMDDLYKVSDKSDREFALGPTHEEIVTPLVKKFVNSYKDLPVYIYQFQNKFRMELRAKSGLLRTREFMMKDLYSFHTDDKDLDEYYEKAKEAYLKIFKRLELEAYFTYASGGTFSKYSHEFQVVTEAGEDEISICKKCKVAINKEIINEHKVCPECGNKDLVVKKSIEVGNIFKLKDKYSKPFDLTFKDKDGKDQVVIMGCYGFGPARALGTLVEVHHDENGIIWPESVAPFKVHLITIGGATSDGEKIYKDLVKNGIEVLFDDREVVSAGQKFSDADLIGCPIRLVVSEKTLEKDSVEYKERNKKEAKLIKISEITKFVK